VKKVVLGALGAAIVTFIIGYFVAVRILFPPLPEPKDGIVVPNLTGLTVAAAEAKLAQVGLRLNETIDITHPSQRAGTIIAQSPIAGQQLRTAGLVQVGVAVPMPMPVPLPMPVPESVSVLVDTPVFDTIPLDTIR
jgi:hypothetical protein